VLRRDDLAEVALSGSIVTGQLLSDPGCSAIMTECGESCSDTLTMTVMLENRVGQRLTDLVPYGVALHERLENGPC